MREWLAAADGAAEAAAAERDAMARRLRAAEADGAATGEKRRDEAAAAQLDLLAALAAATQAQKDAVSAEHKAKDDVRLVAQMLETAAAGAEKMAAALQSNQADVERLRHDNAALEEQQRAAAAELEALRRVEAAGRSSAQRGRPSRTIYMDGVFDLFHVGHLEAVRQCAELGHNYIGHNYIVP